MKLRYSILFLFLFFVLHMQSVCYDSTLSFTGSYRPTKEGRIYPNNTCPVLQECRPGQTRMLLETDIKILISREGLFRNSVDVCKKGFNFHSKTTSELTSPWYKIFFSSIKHAGLKKVLED